MWSRNHDEATATTEASPHPAHVLLVATASRRPRSRSIRGRAARGPVKFHLFAPSPPSEWHPTHPTATKVRPGRRGLARCPRGLRRRTGTAVDGVVSIHRDLLNVKRGDPA